MRDEIARLADIADRLDRAHALLELSQEQSSLEAMASKVDYASSALLGAQAALTELRALARTDHIEDKLGMVADGWRNRIVAVERNSEYDADLRTDTPILILRFASVSLRESANPLAKGWVDRGLVAAALAQPADADADGGK